MTNEKDTTSPSGPVRWSDFQAVLFDLDGVITPTAAVHERAWAQLFADWGYTRADYLEHIDGKPRYDGVQAFLASRSDERPMGQPTDSPGESSICALGNKKNELFNHLLETEGVVPYPGSLTLLDQLDGLGISQAIVSSSKNAKSVLAAAGLSDRFPHIVDGVVAVDENLAGKPAPDMFLQAAKLLAVEPAVVVVVEDASSGVAGGVAGGFGFVLGVDRGGNREALLAHGANAVVDDLVQTVGD